MAGELAAADVLARVETVRPGDRVYTPKGNPEGYIVRETNEYEDGTIVVTYSTGRRSSLRIGDTLLVTDDVLASFAPLRKGERLRLRRRAHDRPVSPRRPSAA